MKKSLQVLLVEDNPADVRITEEAFKESGYTTQLQVANDGIEALELLKGDLPDLILLDLNMPRMNGLELLESVRGDDRLRRIPVIMLTTSDAPRDVSQAYDRFANCYITKPVDLDDFLGVIREIEEFWSETARLPEQHD